MTGVKIGQVLNYFLMAFDKSWFEFRFQVY